MKWEIAKAKAIQEEIKPLLLPLWFCWLAYYVNHWQNKQAIARAIKGLKP